jgi:hypothetical protein
MVAAAGGRPSRITSGLPPASLSRTRADTVAKQRFSAWRGALKPVRGKGFGCGGVAEPKKGRAKTTPNPVQKRFVMPSSRQCSKQQKNHPPQVRGLQCICQLTRVGAGLRLMYLQPNMCSTKAPREMVVELWQFSKLAGSKDPLAQRIVPTTEIWSIKGTCRR